MERAVEANLGQDSPCTVRVSSAEDMILAKLEWYRAGGEISQRQWRDILGIINLQFERLNRDYLNKWAEDLGIDDLLQRAMNEANSHRHPGGE
jgi:hypothetical protein